MARQYTRASCLTIIFPPPYPIRSSRSPPYHMSSFFRDITPRAPPNTNERERVKICQPEYIRNLRPEVRAGSAKSLNRPNRFSAVVKKTSSLAKYISSKPPTARKFFRLVKRKAPAPRLSPKYRVVKTRKKILPHKGTSRSVDKRAPPPTKPRLSVSTTPRTCSGRIRVSASTKIKCHPELLPLQHY